MNALRFRGVALVLVIVSSSLTAESLTAADLRQAVPAHAYLAIHGRHNPERDYQRQYLKDIWQTVKDERLVEQAVELVRSQVDDEDMQRANSAFDELKAAVEPIDWEAVSNFEEMVYAQVMKAPFTYHLVLVRLTPDDAAGCEAAVKNVFAKIAEHSDGKLAVPTTREGDIELTTLGVPGNVPMRPTVARVDDVLVLSTSESLVRQSVAMLNGSGEASKFDDARLKGALGQLPEPEDALVFFDGRQLFTELRKIAPFIEKESRGDEKAARVAAVIDRVLEQFSTMDYAVTSEYTEGYQNRSESFIQSEPNAQGKTCGRMMESGQPFEDWQRWIPADATGYSMSTGVSFHPLYELVVEILSEEIPDGDQMLQKFHDMENQIDVHLDEDILQAFSGEYVQVTLPSAASAGSSDNVFALRCQKPDRVRELLHRGVETLQKFPAVQAQQLALTKCEELDGFEKLSLSALAMSGAEPVIGFHEGWMIIGSRASAVQKVLDTRSGSGPTAADVERFQQFDLDIDGPVYGLSYNDLAAGTHEAANSIRQASMVAPMVIGMSGLKADPEKLQPVLEALKLLPGIAKVVEKFDYFQAKLSVTQAGSEPGTYVIRAATTIRPPGESQPAAAAADEAASETP